MIIAIDLDGTICEEKPTFEKSLAEPMFLKPPINLKNLCGYNFVTSNSVHFVNTLYKLGHTIIIFTARSWSELPMTLEWLKKHKVQYHTVVCGKPVYDVIVDDRSKTNLLDFIKELGEEE